MLPLFKKEKRKKIGLALGGGAARGLAHIAILKVIEENDIPISCIAGTSAGSIIGALYCAGKNWEDIYQIAKQLRWKDLVKPVIPKMGIVKSEKLEMKIKEFIGERSIEELEIPFAATAVDITNGDEVVLRKGSTARAVRASCSIPAIFEPTIIDGKMLIDGGLRDNVPMNVVFAMGAEYVIGVNLNSDHVREKHPENIFDVLYYSFSVIINNTGYDRDCDSGILIEPNLGKFNYYDLKNMDAMMDITEGEFKKHLPEIIEVCL